MRAAAVKGTKSCRPYGDGSGPYQIAWDGERWLCSTKGCGASAIAHSSLTNPDNWGGYACTTHRHNSKAPITIPLQPPDPLKDHTKATETAAVGVRTDTSCYVCGRGHGGGRCPYAKGRFK